MKKKNFKHQKEYEQYIFDHKVLGLSEEKTAKDFFEERMKNNWPIEHLMDMFLSLWPCEIRCIVNKIFTKHANELVVNKDE